MVAHWAVGRPCSIRRRSASASSVARPRHVQRVVLASACPSQARRLLSRVRWRTSLRTLFVWARPFARRRCRGVDSWRFVSGHVGCVGVCCVSASSIVGASLFLSGPSFGVRCVRVGSSRLRPCLPSARASSLCVSSPPARLCGAPVGGFATAPPALVRRRWGILPRLAWSCVRSTPRGSAL